MGFILNFVRGPLRVCWGFILGFYWRECLLEKGSVGILSCKHFIFWNLFTCLLNFENLEK